MTYKFYIAKEKEWDEWEIFNLQQGNVFQSKTFAQAIKKTNTEINLLLAKKDEDIVGGCYYFFPLNGIKKIFSELRIISGPIISNHKILPQLLKIITKIAINKKVISINIRALNRNQEIYLKKGFTISKDAPDYSFNLNLNQSPDKLKKQLNKRTRNAINKAQREGLIIEQTEDINLVYSLYMNRAKEKKGQIPIPKNYFKEIKSQVNTKILIAKINNKPIAESMFLEYQNIIYYFNNGSDPNYWKFNPNTSLIWHIIKENANKDKILNLYGVPDGKDKNHHSYGVYKFKSSFGGNLEKEFIYANKIISPNKKRLFEITKKILLPLYKQLK